MEMCMDYIDLGLCGVNIQGNADGCGDINRLGQAGTAGGSLLLHIKINTGVLEQSDKCIVVIHTETDEPLYPGVDQHLGTEHAGGMGAVNGAAFKADTMQSRLYDHILLGVNSPANFVPFPGGDTQLIPQAAQFQAILLPGRSAVIARS